MRKGAGKERTFGVAQQQPAILHLISVFGQGAPRADALQEAVLHEQHLVMQ